MSRRREDLRLVAGPSWWQARSSWKQEEFVSAELVQIRDTRWTPDKSPEREYYEKYQVQTNRGAKATAAGRTVVFGTRVTDIAKSLGSSPDPLIKYNVHRALCAALGCPVLRWVEVQNGQRVKMELRKHWEHIERKKRDLQKSGIQFRVDLDYEQAAVQPFEDVYSSLQIMEFHRNAFLHPAENLARHAELGTRCHQLIEVWINNGAHELGVIRFKENGQDFEYDLSREEPEVQNSLSAFFNFWKAQKLKLHFVVKPDDPRGLSVPATEVLLADMARGVCGMVDCVCLGEDDKLVLLDWKTTGGVYTEALLQASGYASMWELWHPQEVIDRAFVARFDKVTGAFQTVPVFTTPDKKTEMFAAWDRQIEVFRFAKEANKWIMEYGPQRDEEEDAA